MAEVFPCLNPRCREGDIPQCAACRTYFQRYRDAITSPVDPWPQGWDGRDKEAFQRAIAGVTVDAPSREQFVKRAMDLAFQWAHASYCKGLGRPFSDIEPIRAQLREHLTAGVGEAPHQTFCTPPEPRK